MKNQNYALGTRGTLNMLNKVVAKLARKPGEVTRGSGLAGGSAETGGKGSNSLAVSIM